MLGIGTRGGAGDEGVRRGCKARQALAWLLLAIAAAPVAVLHAQAAPAVPQLGGNTIGAAPALREEKNEQGLPVGAFTLLPRLELSGAYDDNIFLLNHGKLDDALFTVEPSVELRSGWLNNSLNLRADSIHTRYASHPVNDTDQYKFDGDGSVTIMRDWIFSGSASYGHLILPRGTPEDEETFGRFIFNDVTSGSGGIAYRAHRLLLSGRGSTTRLHYEDIREPGGRVDQSFRDHRLDSISARVDYEISQSGSLFVSYTPDRYVYDHDRPELDRSSTGYTVLGGFNAEITRLIKGEVGLGYLKQNFKSASFASFAGFSYQADLSYAPTPLTTLRLQADRSLINSGLPQVPGVRNSRGALTVEHELTARLTLQATVEHDHDRFRGIARTDDRLYVSVSGHLLLRKFLSLVPFYKYQQRSTNDDEPFGRYHDNRAGLSLVVAP